MNLIEIFSILIIHWIADFVLQTDKEAKGKSSNWNDLLSHTLSYTLLWTIVGCIYVLFFCFSEAGLFKLVAFILITFICHTITDYFTSRLNKRLWEKGKVHDFFVSIGFDQVLHYIQLFLTYNFLTQ